MTSADAASNVPSSRLVAEVRPRAELTGAQRERMYRIMAAHFDNVSQAQFLADLDEKESVLVMTDAAHGELRGFSTIGLLTATVDGRPVTGLFSGDTIIEPEFWGESGWLSVWAAYAFALADARAPEPLYWLLLTATHRSYRIMAACFREFYPRHDRATPEEARARIEALVRCKFPGEYDAARGVVVLRDQIPVRPERVDPATEERGSPEIRFFRESNPGYAQGDFLVCLTELSRDNVTPLGRRILGEH